MRRTTDNGAYGNSRPRRQRTGLTPSHRRNARVSAACSAYPSAADVPAVLASLTEVRVSSLAGERVHCLVADARGRCASVEFLDGKPVVHAGDDLPTPALANSAYGDSLERLRGHTGFGGDEPPRPWSRGGDRFSCAADRVRTLAADGRTPTVADAFGVLDEVAQGDFTKWSIVYDIAGRAVHFRTRDLRERRTVRLSGLDFADARMLDLNAGPVGDVTERLEPYEAARNRKLVADALAGTALLPKVPAFLAGMVARWPEMQRKGDR